MADHGFFAICH